MWGFFVGKINYETLYNKYSRTLELEGEQYFRDEVLTTLRAEEKEGVVTATGVLDENTSIRRSAVPVELRLSAAEGALIDFRSGCRDNAGGVRCVNINRGGSAVNL